MLLYIQHQKCIKSARSVVASYKPPMLVTRVRRPACAFFRQKKALGGIAPGAGAWGFYIFETKWRRKDTQAPARPPVALEIRDADELGMPKFAVGTSPRKQAAVLPGFGFANAISARSVPASYKPPILVTRVRLPACAFFRQKKVLGGIAPGAGAWGFYIFETKWRRKDTQAPARPPVALEIRDADELGMPKFAVGTSPRKQTAVFTGFGFCHQRT